VWGSEFTSKAASKLDLIQTQVAQRQILRVEVYVRALRASQNAKRSKVEAAKVLEEGRGGTLLLWYLAQPSFAYEDTRTEEAAERRRAHSADHAGREVEEHRAWCVLAARGLVVEHADGVEMRVIVAKVSPSPPMPCSSHSTS